MHLRVLVDRANACVNLVVEELSNGEHSKFMSVTQHLQTPLMFNEKKRQFMTLTGSRFVFFGMVFQYFSFSPLFQERKPSKNINDINFERENI